jgi:acyl-coenzyme A thioesterase PaaI-like protein
MDMFFSPPDLAPYLRAGWQPMEDDGFAALVGPFLRLDGPGGVRFGFPTSAKHKNRRGVLQGGALATFADRALGLALRESLKVAATATVQLNLQFLDAVKIGEFVEVAPEISRSTRQIVFVRGTLLVSGRAVADAQGIWKLLAS